MKPIAFLIKPQAAAEILAAKLGGSKRGWKQRLADDRAKADPDLPFEGTRDGAHYYQHWIYEYIRRYRHGDETGGDCSVHPDFCVFQPIVDAVSAGSWTAFQRNVDDVSG